MKFKLFHLVVFCFGSIASAEGMDDVFKKFDSASAQKAMPAPTPPQPAVVKSEENSSQTANERMSQYQNPKKKNL